MILYAKYGEHQPLNRQSEAYVREGIALDVATLADHVGAGTAVLRPLTELIRRYVFVAERVHGDDTTVPVLAPASPTLIATPKQTVWGWAMDEVVARG
jgi:transposase